MTRFLLPCSARFLRSKAPIGCVVAACFLSQDVAAFTYINAGESNPGSVTHAHGYDGTGGNFNITVGFNFFNTGSFNSDAAISVQNAIANINALNPVTGNLSPGAISPTAFDFESIFLHELGHALGLGHPNFESTTDESLDQSVWSAAGVNGVLDLDAGTDGLFGTADDARDDDINLTWRPIATNDPFSLPGTVDTTTFRLDTTTEWPNTPTSEVALSEFGLANTEAVMIQGATAGELQRRLGHDDVAGLRFAMAGLDGVSGTGDDYTFTLQFVEVGLFDPSPDILITNDLIGGQLATTSTSSSLIGGSGHYQIGSGASISINASANFEFNTIPVPEPNALILIATAGVFLLVRRR